MPKEQTHWLVAQRALAGLTPDSRLRAAVDSHHPVYLTGAVLPDTLLHLFRGPWAADVQELARSFHDTCDNSFSPLIAAEKRFPEGLPPALLACLLGVITHIETDIVFHPFVYALTGPAGIGRHYQIETDIDSHFLCNGTIPAITKLSDLVTPETRQIISGAGALLFDPDNTLPPSALDRALTLHCRFQAMYDSTFWKIAVRLLAQVAGSPFSEQRHLFYPWSNAAAADCFDDTQQEWHHPVTGEFHRTTLEELLDAAVQRSTSLFALIDETGSLAEALSMRPGENLLTGLPGVCQRALRNRTPGVQ